MSQQIIDSCTGYFACALATQIDPATFAQFDWTMIGATVLLIARLISDVPVAIKTIFELYKKYKESRDDKGNG